MNARSDASHATAPATTPPLSQRRSADGDQKARAEDLNERAPLEAETVVHALTGFLVFRR